MVSSPKPELYARGMYYVRGKAFLCVSFWTLRANFSALNLN